MKKILVLSCFLLIVICKTPVAQTNAKQDTLKAILTKLASVDNYAFAPFSFKNIYNNACVDGYIYDNGETKGILKDLQDITIDDVNIECFLRTQYRNEFHNSSDECILARRNTKLDSSCGFDYKMYLPKGSKISTGDEFIVLSNVVDFFYNKDFKNEFCMTKQEITSSEREQCYKDVDLFIKNIATKQKIAHCRDKVKNEYYDLLQTNKNYANLLQSAINEEKMYHDQFTGNFMGNLYEQEIKNQIINRIKEFGYSNLCDTTGFAEDIKKLK